MSRVIIAGGRDFDDRSRMSGVMDMLLTEGDQIVSGMCRGADTLAWDIGNDWGYEVREMPADWDKYGKRAGFVRNREMAEVADTLIAFWDGESPGTRDMIRTATKLKLEVHVYRYKP